MTSATVKSAFKTAGIKVRVRDTGRAFNICPVGEGSIDKAESMGVAASLGLTGPTGDLGGQWSAGYYVTAYKPGRVVRVGSTSVII